ncbi:hypothetical protein BYT27DRAFT_7041765, partial [Phlegmacium glaucopus]
CLSINPTTGVICNTWDWLATSRTPSCSPGSSHNVSDATVTLQEATTRVEDLRLRSQLPENTLREICRMLGCNSTRIRQNCRRRMCKKHCREVGGCLEPPHFVSEATACQDLPSISSSAPPPPVPLQLSQAQPPNLNIPTPATAPPLASNSLIDPTLCGTHLKLPPPSSARPVHHQVEPVFASHMTPIFTQQWATEQELREKQRQYDASRIENARKAKHTVMIYAWTEEDTDPNIVQFQEGFTWPYFEINDHVLDLADISPLPANRQFKVFNTRLGIWTTAHSPYIIEVNEQASSIFIKRFNVITHKDLPRYAKFQSQPAPNVRTNLMGERAYMKQRMVEHEL